MKNTKTFNAFLKESKIENIEEYSTIGLGIDEKNADGTISDDENEKMEDLLGNVEIAIDNLIEMIKKEANEIGGSFRSPGYTTQCARLIRERLKKAKML